MNKSIARIKGKLQAIADSQHPLKTVLKLVLTDFEPNQNRQGVPQEEKENIIRTAEDMPLKINFDGEEHHGHSGAVAVGPIRNVTESVIDGRPVIIADGIVWSEMFGEVSSYLKEAFANGIGTSWEIYYSDSEMREGIEWLKGCVFAGTCIVDTPAYGPERTRVLAIAEKLQEMSKEQNTRAETDPEVTDVEEVVEETTTEVTEEEVDNAQAGDEFEEVRNSIVQAEQLLFEMFEGLESLHAKTFSIEREKKESNLDGIASNFGKLLTELTERFNALSEASAELEKVKAETARNNKVTSRKLRYIEVGLDEEGWQANEEKYMNMADELYEQYIADLAAVASKTSKSEVAKIRVPEPVRNDAPLTKEDLVAALREELKINKTRG